MIIARIAVTDEARGLIAELKAEHGPLMFHQSGGCCDGSAPMCFVLGEFLVSAHDVLLGVIEDCPFYMSASQFEYWQHTHLTIDRVKGRGAGFSLEAPRGVRFLIRSRLFSDDEQRLLAEAGPPPRGDEHGQRVEQA